MLQAYRHVVVLLASAVLAVLFTLSKDEPITIGLLGLGMADAAILMLCLTMSIGPAIRLVPRLQPLLCWRRQLGIGVTVASTLHVVAFAIPDVLALPGLVLEEKNGRVFLDTNLTAAVSWVGITAFMYALVLGITSNDFSQRVLKAGWYRLHAQSYAFFVLAVVHALIAVYLVAEARSSWFDYLLWLGLAVAVVLHGVDFVASVRRGDSVGTDQLGG